MDDSTKRYVLEVANFVQKFPAMPIEEVGQLFIDTPAQAAAHAVNAVPIPERARVADVISRLTMSNDFSKAAEQIRQA